MSWDTELVERLRYVINDLDPTDYTWTDVQLQKYLAIATINVLNDLAQYGSVIGTGYAVNVSATGSTMITPDPTASSSIGFSNLIVFQAACIIARGDLKKAGKTGGWKIIDDRSTIDGTSSIQGAKDIVDDYCGAYAATLAEFKRGNQFAGQAILSPYASANGFPGWTFRYGTRGGF